MSTEIDQLLNQLARRERGRLIATLVHRLGARHLALAEDVAQDALLKALALWPYQGIPDKPSAWLQRVAYNKAIDCLRRAQREQAYDSERDGRTDALVVCDANEISDPELRTIFLCCHPVLPVTEQLALTLRIVGGFTARELADLFFSNEDALSQRLSRSKRKLRSAQVSLTLPAAQDDIAARLDAVLKSVYLLFSVGYAPGSGSQLIRRDVAHEALRLATELANLPLTATPTAKALAALLCLHASRFDAREDAEGKPVLFRQQDRAKWNRALIDQGMRYLQAAGEGEVVSRYHLEAAIASVYATAPDWERINWPLILDSYARLQQLTDSPVVSINGCVAQAFAGAPAQALARLDALDQAQLLREYAPYHVARAEVLRLLDRPFEAKQSYDAALQSRASTPVLRFFEQRQDAL